MAKSDRPAHGLRLVEDGYLPMCPRCSGYSMGEEPEEVEGAGYDFTHQCGACGMGIQHQTYDAWEVKNLKDIFRYIGVTTWLEFLDWLDEYGDGEVYVDECARDVDPAEVLELTTFAYPRRSRVGIGQTIEFPSTVREFFFDLQSAQDVAASAWRDFTGDAARRLKPLSEAGYGWFDDADGEQMPDAWTRDDDGSWHDETGQQVAPVSRTDAAIGTRQALSKVVRGRASSGSEGSA